VLREAAWVERFAVLLGEHPARVDPGVAPLLSFVFLAQTPGSKHGDRQRVEADRAVAGFGLGLAELLIFLVEVVGVDDGLTDVAHPGVEIDVGPGKSDYLGASERSVGDQVQERVKPVTGDGVEERTGLLGCPHHRRRGTPARPPPVGDALERPDQRPSGSTRLQPDVGCRIPSDGPASLCFGEIGVQDHVHTADAGPAERSARLRRVGSCFEEAAEGRCGTTPGCDPADLPHRRCGCRQCRPPWSRPL
jgi:hypothetical protein